MATHAMMGFIKNKKHDLVYIHKAMNQHIQEHLMSADDNIGISQSIVPHTLLTPLIDLIITR